MRRKKLAVAMLVSAFVFSALAVGAKGVEKVDLKKPVRVENFKINQKQVLSADQLQKSEDSAKGKTDSKSSHSKPTPVPPPLPVVGYASGVLGGQLPSDAKKHAVVIGLSNYYGTTNDLCVKKTTASVSTSCADGDSLHMQEALNQAGFSDVALFRDSDATFSDIEQKVQDIMSTAGPDDEIVFFFSGHSTSSTQDIFNDGVSNHLGLALYGMPVDSGEVIWDEQLQNWFSGAQPTQRVIFIFDTCHAGELESYLQGPNREVIMSSTADQSSYTYSLGSNKGPGEGLFTHYFVVNGILNGQADGYNALISNKTDGKVALEEAYGYARSIISATQLPLLNDYAPQYDLVLGY